MSNKYLIVVFIVLVVLLNGTDNSVNIYSDFEYYDSFEKLKSQNDFNLNGITSNNLLKINNKNKNSGNTAIEISGNLNGQQYSMLNADFNVKNITGNDIIDMSDKIIAVNTFVPVNSPIDYLCFTLIKNGKFVVTGGRSVKQGAWSSVELNLRSVYDMKAWDYKGSLTDDEALDIIKNCQFIQVKGQRNTGGNSANTYLIIDDLRWKTASINFINKIIINDKSDSLRKYADNKNFIFGSATGVKYLYDENYSQILAGDFNMIVPEYCLKWECVEPEENKFVFTEPDILVKFAEQNNMKFRGHTLLWHQQIPKWIQNKKYDELTKYIENHIENVMGRYKGKIFAWDVFNEVVKDDGTGLRNNKESESYNFSIWSNDQNDISLIKSAFVKAHQVDPQCKLFLNDYNMEETGKAKSERFYKLVIELLKEKVPINGVGFQLHLDESSPPDFNKIRNNVKRYTDLGLEVHFTEIDVRINIKDIDLSIKSGKKIFQDRLKHQALIYGELLKIAIENKNVTAYITWNFTDKYSWIPFFFNGYDGAHLFDKDLIPKPAYYELLKILKGD